MPTRIAGVVVRAKDRHVTASFYAALGLETNEHEHGGPKHYTAFPVSPECVLEIYSRSEKYSVDTVLIQVDLIQATLQKLHETHPAQQIEIKGTDKMKFCYLKDPDGRDVMLFESF